MIKCIFRIRWLLCALLVVCGCSGLEKSEKEKLRRANAKGEFILRSHDEFSHIIAIPKFRAREKYPWERNFVGNFPKITKEYFRCKGKSTNVARVMEREFEETVHLFDCGGGMQHSLPIHEGREFIYPALIEILNYIQARTCKKVMITCGHRCPEHNVYSDSSKYNQSSKHMIGAEVDFYVAGLETEQNEVMELIFRYYHENAQFKGREEYENFSRYEKEDTDVSTPPWYNREIYVKLYQRHEGRDIDNQHPYPYISIQIIRDRETNQRVSYSWAKAYKGYHRF